MDPVGTTKEAVDLLLKVIKFVRGYRDIPKDIKNSLDHSLKSSSNLKMWMDVFDRLDRTSIPENYSANLFMNLTNLKVVLDTHRCQIEGWMDVMGLPMCPVEREDGADPSTSSPKPTTVRKSSQKLLDFVAPIRKSIYVLNGSNTVKSIEKKIKEAEVDVMNIYLTIFPFAAFKSFRPDSDSAIELPIVRFLSAARKRREDKVSVNTISAEEWDSLYTSDEADVDENVAHEHPLSLCMIHPRQAGDRADLGKQMLLGKYIRYSRSNNADENESMNLARLFADDEDNQSSSSQFGTFRGDGDMLRLSALVRTKRALQFVFKVPPGSAKIHTLRTLLLDKQESVGGRPIPLHPIAERVKLSIRLATSVLVVHSLGLVHKLIQPESILVIDADGLEEFPYTLGYPYLVGFHLSRSKDGRTDYMKVAKPGIYSHPRDQVAERTEKYSMISDIYSLGVCLFEVALWRSLFIVDPDETKKKRDYVPDKAAGFEKLADDYYKKGTPVNERAKAKTAELIRISRNEIPKTMGDRFADVVVACLCAGYPDSPFADHDDLKEEKSHTDTRSAGPFEFVSVKYLELVLKNLQAVYDGLSSTR